MGILCYQWYNGLVEGPVGYQNILTEKQVSNEEALEPGGATIHYKKEENDPTTKC